MVKRRVKINENINISEKVTARVIRAVENAEHQLEKDKDSLKLMKKIESGTMSMNDIKDKERLNILIDYGMVNRLLNNEVVVSGIGFQALKDLSKNNQSEV